MEVLTGGPATLVSALVTGNVKKARVGQPFSFNVDFGEDAAGGQLTAEADQAAACTVTCRGPGSYAVCCTLSVLGTQQVRLLMDGNPLASVPIEVGPGEGFLAGPNYEVQAHGLQVRKTTGTGWNMAALGMVKASSGVHSWILRLVEDVSRGEVFFGLAPPGSPSVNRPFESFGYHFYLVNGTKYSGPPSNHRLGAFGTGPPHLQPVTMVLDCSARTIAFQHDKMPLRVAYTDVSLPLSLMVAMHDPNTVIEICSYSGPEA